MASDTSRAKAKLAALTASFDDLDALLEPLFAETLPETLLALEPLQQAKLQTVLPYIIYDLIFIFLKARGIDPKTHPVIPELDRIRQYFEKISHAENPPAKRTEIDKAAAGRFIKHAIAQAQWKKTAAEEMQEQDQDQDQDQELELEQESDAPLHSAPSTSTARAPPPPGRITQKMRARAAYEQAIKQEDVDDDAAGSGDDVLAVFADADADAAVKVEADASSSKGKGKGKETATAPSTRPKRRRAAVDVFTGLADEQSPKKVKSSSPSPPIVPQATEPSQTGSSTPASLPDKSKSSSKKTKKKNSKK